jgi:hypothetical protein
MCMKGVSDGLVPETLAASEFDGDASTQSTLSSSSRPASPIATFQIPPSHPCI